MAKAYIQCEKVSAPGNKSWTVAESACGHGLIERLIHSSDVIVKRSPVQHDLDDSFFKRRRTLPTINKDRQFCFLVLHNTSTFAEACLQIWHWEDDPIMKQYDFSFTTTHCSS